MTKGYPAGKFTADNKPCAAEGCPRLRQSNAPWAKNIYCAKHHARARLHGDPHHERFVSPWERFVDRVQVAANDCWLWLGSGAGRGDAYGQFWFNNQTGLAHRFAYETMVGPIPGGMELDHLCRVQKCVNPAHLEPVTAKENIRRMRVAQEGATK